MSAPRIVVLPPEVVNQIAAGEVVERPASVVKELVENALDAGARRVDVEVEEGGLRAIRVVDDGCGMTPEELELCLERHATSKLRSALDLLEVRTMGFRGEALPSIASVARLTLRSRPPGAELGHQLRVEAGRVLEREPVGCRTGTLIEVADLFFNTPARLKFLRSSATEAAHASDAVTRLALASPEVHLTLTVDGRRTLELPPCRDRLERARAVLGRRGAGLATATLEDDGLRVEACLAPAEQSGRTAQAVTLLVNRRFVRDRSLVHAVGAGYGELLPPGRYPLAVVHLELDPSRLDVNVHPQKIEVRLAEPDRIYSSLRRCVRAFLAGARPQPAGEGPGASGSALVGSEPARTYRLAPAGEGGYEEHKRRIQEATRRFWSAQAGLAPPPPRAGEAVAPYPLLERAASSATGYFGRLRVLGQALGTYLLCEGEGELVLIDQHAAHERVTFEQLRLASRAGALPSQRLLIPVVVALEPRLEAAAREAEAALGELGFELDPFGAATWPIRAVPEALRTADPAALLCEVLEELAAVGATQLVSAAREEVLARMACHGSVRGGRALDEGEIGALLASLDQVDFAGACPHGRPVLLRLGRGELERRFGRQ